MKLLRLTYRDFKAQSQNIVLNGHDVDIFGANGTGKTTAFDAFTWLLFGKDSKGTELSEDIKALSEMDNGREHEAEAMLQLDDGTHIKLKRVYHETWTRKRGQATESFSGHTTDFYIDDVPAKKKEYAGKIDVILPEQKFKLLTDPLYFKNQLSWQDRRKTLMEMCGGVSDDEVIASVPELAKLPQLLDGKAVDDYRKMLQAQRTKLNDELKKVPVRIDEATRNLPDIDLDKEAIEQEAAKLEEYKAGLSSKILSIKQGSAVAEKQKEIAEVESGQLEIKNNYSLKVNKEAIANQSLVGELKGRKSRLMAGIEEAQHNLVITKHSIDKSTKAIERTREDWYAENSKEYIDDIEDTCPICGQKIPQEKITAARQKAMEAFNFAKSEKLAGITEAGKAEAKKMQENVKLAEKLQDDITTKQTDITELEGDIASLESKASDILDYQQDEAYLAAEAKKAKLKSEIEAIRLGSTEEINEIRAEIAAADSEIKACRQNIALIESKQALKKRIEELTKNQQELAAEFENLEHALYLTDIFIRAKVSLLDEKINSRFKIAQFRLFEQQVNGGLAECCDVLYDGVARMSNSQEIKAGLDIIQTLGEHYKITAPVFVDNCESVTELPPMDSQVIRLIVSADDKKLRIVRVSDKEEE